MCLTSLSTIFQLYYGGKFYCRRTPEPQEETINLQQVTDKLHHKKLYQEVSAPPPTSGNKIHNSNYHSTSPIEKGHIIDIRKNQLVPICLARMEFSEQYHIDGEACDMRCDEKSI